MTPKINKIITTRTTGTVHITVQDIVEYLVYKNVMQHIPTTAIVSGYCPDCTQYGNPDLTQSDAKVLTIDWTTINEEIRE